MGVAVSEDGAEQGSMGVAVGDYDNTGRFSLWVTNFAEEYNALYHNEGDHFTDVSFRSKTAAVSLPYVGWGNAFFDYDNDGLLDMIVVNGHVYPQLDKARLRASAGYRQRKLLFHNRGDGTFDEVGAQAGPVMTDERVSRGLAIGDLDDDGKLDIVINDLDGSPQILRNEITPIGNWLKVRLKGRGAELRCDRRRRRRSRRQHRAAPARAEREQLHFAGGQARAVRSGKGGTGRFGSGDVARRLHLSAAEREGEPDYRAPAAVSAVSRSGPSCCRSRSRSRSRAALVASSRLPHSGASLSSPDTTTGGGVKMNLLMI